MAVIVKAKRLRTADDPPEVARRLGIADRGAQQLAAVLFDGFAALRERITEDDVRRAVTAYDWRIVGDKLDTVTFTKAVDPAELVPVEEVLQQVALDTIVAEVQTQFGGGGGSGVFGFNVVNPRAVAWAQQHAAELMNGLLDESKLAIQQLISRAVAGTPGASAPRDTAQLIQHTIGLNPRQVQAVGNYRAGLYEAISRGWTPDQLRSRWGLSPVRYPGQMTPDRVEEFVRKYADKQLKYRSMMVARTETLRAAHAGQQMSWEEMIRGGYLSPTSRKVWMVTRDSRLCPVCAPMNGQTVEIIGGEFTASEKGLLESQRVTYDGPTVGYPPLHPMCRCTVVLESGPGGKVLPFRGPAGGVVPAEPVPAWITDNFSTLDPSRKTTFKEEIAARRTPEGKSLQRGINLFSSDTEEAQDIRASGERLIHGGTAQTDNELSALRMLQAISGGPTRDKALYRGLGVASDIDSLLAQYAEGSEFDLGLSSFSSSQRVAEGFAEEYGSKGTRIMIRTKGPTRAVPAEKISEHPQEKEWITTGRFRVVDAKVVDGVLRLDVEQLNAYESVIPLAKAFVVFDHTLSGSFAEQRQQS